MKIVFIHYHLKTGGVTTVIKQQVETLRDKCDILVLTGEQPEDPFPADTVYVPGIGYDSGDDSPGDPAKTAGLITDAIFSKWKDGCDVLHAHNPCLAKNINFLTILRKLQEKGLKLFAQIHDFAEDGRPLAYNFSDEYMPDCHYGVINSRDYGILLRSGLKPEGIHRVFNTVTPFVKPEEDVIPENFVIYPVRAIRRKNIGEALLVSHFFRNSETLAITRSPNSSADIQSFEGWKRYAAENRFNTVFDASSSRDFSELVRFARFVITTSITEGFGFSFLEPWTARKALWGRKIPDICKDFEINGIDLGRLYRRLTVPVEWFGKEEFYKVWKSSLQKNCAVFNSPVDLKDIDRAFAGIIQNECIDFGLLDERFQKKVISRILSDNKYGDILKTLNPYLENIDTGADDMDLIENNFNKVAANYNTELYKKNLLDIYTKVINIPVSHRINKKILLSQFMAPANFSLLKWGEYAE